MNTPRRTVGVVGLGAWGSALALHCARVGHTVIGWHRDEAFISAARSTGQLRCGSIEAAIPNSLTVTAELKDTASCDLTIVALPSAAWSEVLPRLPHFKILISATKGLERTTAQTPLTFAHSKLQIPQSALCVISGPSFASDLAAGHPVSVTAASCSEQTATAVAEALSGASLRVYTSTDPLGVELGGILKNVIAIACGASDSLGFGPSARAALIARGLAEMSRLAVAAGADARTLSGLSGLGDLVMTATEDQSRNRQVGLRLGCGDKIGQIIDALGSTAEGVSTAPLVQQLAKRSGIETPITDLVAKLIEGTIAPADLANALMTRPIKSEFD